jgi:hypothetical protein
MMNDELLGEEVKLLASLEQLTSDPRRALAVRMRCHAKLARVRRQQAQMKRIVSFWQQVIAPVIAVSCCLIYFAALVATAFRIHGLLK